jgi:4-hydroxy-3-polyprenylbenzoate decarboxylase
VNITVGITGASGAVFAQQLLMALEADERVTHVDCVASESSLRVAAEELGLSGRSRVRPQPRLSSMPRTTSAQA